MAMTGLRRAPILLIAALVGVVLLSVAAYPRLERVFLERTGASASATLDLATQVLRGALNRTEALPALLAERPILAQLLRDPDNAGLRPFVNEQLRQSALSLDVSDIYLMDTSGLTLAASSYRTDRSFVGRRFDYRPYLSDAVMGGLGRFHALGTTSGERGYYFAAPVIDGTDIAGVIAVKITLDRFEETWAESEATIIVTDTSNVIFMSDREDWHFRTLGPVSEAALDEIAATRQYPPGTLAPLNARRDPLGSRFELITIESAAGSESYVIQTDLVAAAGWRVSILSPTGPAQVQALVVLAVVGLTLLFILLVATAIWQRRVRLMERLYRQQTEQTRLEARVAEMRALST